VILSAMLRCEYSEAVTAAEYHKALNNKPEQAPVRGCDA